MQHALPPTMILQYIFPLSSLITRFTIRGTVQCIVLTIHRKDKTDIPASALIKCSKNRTITGFKSEKGMSAIERPGITVVSIYAYNIPSIREIDLDPFRRLQVRRYHQGRDNDKE